MKRKRRINLSQLMSLSVPETYIGKTFETLFPYMIEEKHILVIALFRKTFTPMEIDYIVTNPQRNTILRDTDKLYGLGDSLLQYDGIFYYYY